MNEIVSALKATQLNAFIVSNSWVWPAMETLHFIGLCLLLGSLLIVDLRAIGFARGVPFRLVDKFIIATLVGFGINAITGALFVVGDPGRYFINIAFQLKMALIAVAGLNALFFTLKVRPMIKASDDDLVLPTYAKSVAALSLTLWVSVIVLGRLIPYVEQ